MRRIVPVLLILAAPLGAQGAPDTLRVARVDLEGVVSLDARMVRAALQTRPRAPLDSAALARDAERIAELYAAWGYPDAAVASAADTLRGGRARVRFRVAEGAPVRVGRVELRPSEGASPIGPAELPIAPGDVYALPRVDAARRVVARAYAERGHAFVQVRVPERPVVDGRADLVLEVVPGPVARFGPVTVRAEAPLDSDEARRRLPIRAGERFHPARLEHAAERLHALPIVDSASLRPGPVSWAPDVVETEVDVGTGRGGAYEVRGIVSSATCIGFEGFVAHRHAFGRPRVVSLTAGTTNLFASDVCGAEGEGGFTEPGYHLRAALAEPVGRASWLLLDAAYLREAVPGAFVRSGWRLRAGGAREVARGVDVELAVAPERSEPTAAGALACALHGACGGGPGASLLVPVEAALTWERPDLRAALAPPPPGPAWAHPARARWVPGASVSLAAAGPLTGSEHAFLRALAEASLTRVEGRFHLGGRVRAGWLAGADAALPPQLRLFGGGARGVRGAPPHQLGTRVLVLRPGVAPASVGEVVAPGDVLARGAGGDRLLEATVEGRAWVHRRAQVAAFLDYGALRSRGGAAGLLAGARTESLLAPGVGVLALTPVGAVRVDVAYDASPERTYPLLRALEGGGYEALGMVRLERGDGFRDRLRLQIGMGLPF